MEFFSETRYDLNLRTQAEYSNFEPSSNKNVRKRRTGSLYRFAHASKLTRFELIPRRFLEPEHEELPLKVDYLLVDLLRRLRTYLLHLLFLLRHPHHQPSSTRSVARRRSSNCGPKPDSTEGRSPWGKNWRRNPEKREGSKDLMRWGGRRRWDPDSHHLRRWAAPLVLSPATALWVGLGSVVITFGRSMESWNQGL